MLGWFVKCPSTQWNWTIREKKSDLKIKRAKHQSGVKLIWLKGFTLGYYSLRYFTIPVFLYLFFFCLFAQTALFSLSDNYTTFNKTQKKKNNKNAWKVEYNHVCWFQRSLLLIASLCGGVWLHSLFGTMLLRLFVSRKKNCEVFLLKRIHCSQCANWYAILLASNVYCAVSYITLQNLFMIMKQL